jgi:hypothetical protein
MAAPKSEYFWCSPPLSMKPAPSFAPCRRRPSMMMCSGCVLPSSSAVATMMTMPRVSFVSRALSRP